MAEKTSAAIQTPGAKKKASTLRISKFRVDPSRLPGDAPKEFEKLSRKLLGYLKEREVDAVDLDRLQSEALWRSLSVDGRNQPLSGPQWVVLALGKELEPVIAALERAEEAYALTIIKALSERFDRLVEQERFNLDLKQVPEWIDAHRGEDDEAEAVAHCIQLDSPREVSIKKRLAQTGAQKRVFAARWTVADDPTDIVLKQFLEQAEQTLIRERRPHPLSMRHPNIIETFMLDNEETPSAETFLVERHLDVLSDERELAGWSEDARLLVDIARALAFLADQGLVHGDVKPDNIGIQNGRFVLLDFGVCRTASEFVGVPQTGSLRTRAPEVLLGGTHTELSDVWSLGATVFRALVGRFPLFHSTDPKPPRADTDPEGRQAFEEELQRRVREDWDDLLAPLANVDHPQLRAIVASMLNRDPAQRPNAASALQEALRTLPSLIGIQEGPRFAPRQELLALEQHLASAPEDIELLPEQRQKDLHQHLDILRRALRAHRHYQTTTERVDRVARVILDDPLRELDGEEREHLQRLADLAKRFRLPADQEDSELLERVEDQLGRLKTPDAQQPEVLLDALFAAIDDVKVAGGNKPLEEAGETLRKLLPAQ